VIFLTTITVFALCTKLLPRRGFILHSIKPSGHQAINPASRSDVQEEGLSSVHFRTLCFGPNTLSRVLLTVRLGSGLTLALAFHILRTDTTRQLSLQNRSQQTCENIYLKHQSGEVRSWKMNKHYWQSRVVVRTSAAKS
jgi:hypothetical protein